MKSSLWHHLDLVARTLWPFTLTVLLLILGIVPLQIPHLAPVSPGFALISVYYWALHRPTILPAPAVFLIGVLNDFFGDAPVGVGALVLLIVYSIIVSQRRNFLGAPFALVWLGFAAVAAGAAFAAWMISSLLFGTAVDPRPAIFDCLLTVGLYPAVAHLFARAQRGLSRRG